jgi:hypothetical protein
MRNILNPGVQPTRQDASSKDPTLGCDPALVNFALFVARLIAGEIVKGVSNERTH